MTLVDSLPHVPGTRSAGPDYRAPSTQHQLTVSKGTQDTPSLGDAIPPSLGTPASSWGSSASNILHPSFLPWKSHYCGNYVIGIFFNLPAAPA